MGLLQKIYYFLSPYTDSRERAAALYFGRLSERSSTAKTRSKLIELMQSNIAVINLWTEHKYKGYRYLRKSRRRELYGMLDVITSEFELFRSSRDYDDAFIARTLGVNRSDDIDKDRSSVLIAITEYLSPANGIYEYRSSSSFGRLLRDPRAERLVGDCNQIVTLYTYLYSRYFPVQDLQVRLLPGHVALHYAGVDIEATNGTFTRYAHAEGAKLLPIEEIVSVNLLDVTDSYLETHEVQAQDFLQAARFAYVLSHDRDIVAQNLEAAYGKIIASLARKHSYTKALAFAKQSRNLELRAMVGHNGAVYHMGRHEYPAARRFAEYSVNKPVLVRESYQSEGAYHYNAGRYQEAIRAFKSCNDQASVAKCYSALFFAEQATLPKQLTSETIRTHAKTIKYMQNYAKKSGDKELVQHVSRLTRYL